jgi:hypothetical protein
MGGGFGKLPFRTPPLVKVRMVRGGPEFLWTVCFIKCEMDGIWMYENVRGGRAWVDLG